MKSIALSLLLVTGFIFSPLSAKAKNANLNKKASVLNKVISLLNLNNNKGIALIQGRNQSNESIYELKEVLESQNFVVTVYERGNTKRIKEDIVMIHSLSTFDSTTKVFDSKIIISDDLNDIKSNSAGISVKDVSGYPRVFISKAYFQNKRMNLDTRLIRASTVF